MAELVDAWDLKSHDRIGHAGSTPALGIPAGRREGTYLSGSSPALGNQIFKLCQIVDKNIGF